ncbi:MAG: DUF2092 domain-containing protein [Desulfuromusa sp.]|nr:DUF2092 domain-containing protein [Desulfuromusa sp.]
MMQTRYPKFGRSFRMVFALLAIVLTLGITPVLAAVVVPTTTATEQDPEAKAILMKMAEFMANVPVFSVTLRSGYDAIQEDGQYIEFGEKRQILLQRPDRLRIDNERSNGERGLLLFDGKKITAFNADDNVYTQVEKSGTVVDLAVVAEAVVVFRAAAPPRAVDSTSKCTTSQRSTQSATRKTGTTQRQAQRQDASGKNQRDREDGRNENREDWQDHQNENREDRQDFADDQWDDHYNDHYYHGNDVAVAFVVGTSVGAAAGASASSSTTYVTTLPCTGTAVIVNGASYYSCGTTWYTRGNQGGTVVYMISSAPAGY